MAPNLDDLQAGAPHEPSSAFALCAAHVLAHHADMAVLLDDLAARFPTFAGGWDQVGKAFLDVGARDDALTCFRRALADEPTASRAVLCGMMLRETGRLDDARAAFEAGAGRGPEAAQAWLGIALCDRDLHRLPEAAAALREAIACEPRLVTAHLDLGKVLQAMGDLDGAKAAYGRAVSLRADSLRPVARALTSERVGELWLDLGRLRRSLEA